MTIIIKIIHVSLPCNDTIQQSSDTSVFYQPINVARSHHLDKLQSLLCKDILYSLIPYSFPNIHILLNSHPIFLPNILKEQLVFSIFIFSPFVLMSINWAGSMTHSRYSRYLQQVWTAKFQRYFSVSPLLDFFIEVYKTSDSHFLKISLPSAPVLPCPSSSFPISFNILLLPLLEFPPSLPIPLYIFMPGFTS